MPLEATGKEKEREQQKVGGLGASPEKVGWRQQQKSPQKRREDERTVAKEIHLADVAEKGQLVDGQDDEKGQ